VHLVRVFNMMPHSLHTKTPAAPAPVPEGFDYDTWCGPAPVLPYNPARHWLNLWDFSCGAIAGDVVHQLDLARHLIGDPPYPDTVVNAGGLFAATDGREVPDTQIVTFEYSRKLTMLFEAALWTPYIGKTPPEQRNKGRLPDWQFNGTRIEMLGTKDLMCFCQHSDGWEVFNENHRSVVATPGRSGNEEHYGQLYLVRAFAQNRPTPTLNRLTIRLCSAISETSPTASATISWCSTRQRKHSRTRPMQIAL
jgi:predicted dehydrogenase